MAAAHELFAQRPYVEVGVAEILHAAKVQAPTLYHHFSDKEGLYVQWAEEAFAKLSLSLRTASEATHHPFDILASFCSTLTQFEGVHLLRTLDCASRLHRSESRERIERAYLQAVFEPLCVILLNAEDAGALSVRELNRTASAFLFGALSQHPRYSANATDTNPNYRWWVDHFAFGFSKPMP